MRTPSAVSSSALTTDYNELSRSFHWSAPKSSAADPQDRHQSFGYTLNCPWIRNAARYSGRYHTHSLLRGRSRLGLETTRMNNATHTYLHTAAVGCTVEINDNTGSYFLRLLEA